MSRFSICPEVLEERRFLSAGPVAPHDVTSSAATDMVVPLAATTTPTPTAGGLTLTEEAGKPFTAKLGEFTQKVIDLSLSAVITWGDGTQSAGKLVGSYATGEYYVQGTHTYSKAATFKVVVKIFGKPIGSPITPTSPIKQFTSVINSIKPSAGGLSLTETATQKFTAKLGEFTQKVIDRSLNAVITWGDGSQSAGVLDGSYATGEYYVKGTHTYATPGVYKVQVKIFAHPSGSPLPGTSPIAQFTSVITAVPLVPTNGGLTLTEVATRKFTAKLGEFTYKTVDQALNAVINWGDGTTSAGTLVGSYATGEYYVKGTHTYAQTGTYKVDVKIFGHLIGSPIKGTSPLAEFISVIKVMGNA